MQKYFHCRYSNGFYWIVSTSLNMNSVALVIKSFILLKPDFWCFIERIICNSLQTLFWLKNYSNCQTENMYLNLTNDDDVINPFRIINGYKMGTLARNRQTLLIGFLQKSKTCVTKLLLRYRLTQRELTKFF